MHIALIIILALIGLYILFEVCLFIAKFNTHVSFGANLYMSVVHRGLSFMFGGNPHCNPEGFVSRRKITDCLQSAIRLPNIVSLSGVTVQASSITTTSGFYEPLYIIRPKNTENEILPFVFFCHGGGFCLGHIGTYESQLKKIAKECHVCIIYCDYRLAPEYKYPTAVYDCYEALIGLLENNKKYNIDPEKCILLGDSAGGNICENLCHMLSKTQYKPIYQILLYPVSDMSRLREFKQDPKYPTCLPEFAGSNMTEFYIKSVDDLNQPMASPLLYDDCSVYPSSFILTCDYDSLTEGTLAFVDKLNRNGIPVIHNHMKNTIHGIWQQPDLTNYINKEIIYYINYIFYYFIYIFIIPSFIVYLYYISILFKHIICYDYICLVLYTIAYLREDSII